MNDQDNLIQCRASIGVAIQTSQPWEAGKPVQFIYAPAGRHMITAGFRKGETITICVENDSQTAVDLQESYDHLMATEPNQEPFGDEDHESKKATLRFPIGVTRFTWGGIKGNEGVIVAAEPTSYGSEAVNGKVYRSWSPEFATDANYAKASKKNGHWTFPDGVKGSESNPARIVGVSFVMGALTNRPAFRAMPPVKARKADDSTNTLTASIKPVTDSALSKLVAFNGGLQIAHWKADTKSNEHKTLGELYDDLIDLTDKFAECFMGKYGVLSETAQTIPDLLNPTEDGLELISQMREEFKEDSDADLLNILADMDTALNKAKYLLKSNMKTEKPIHAHQADELTISDLQSKVQASVSADSRFKGVSDPSGLISCSCYVADIIRDEDKNEWFAVISVGNKMKRVEFLIDAEDGSVVLGDEVKEVARKTVYAVDALCYNGELVKAAGTSEGAKKGWESRVGDYKVGETVLNDADLNDLYGHEGTIEKVHKNLGIGGNKTGYTVNFGKGKGRDLMGHGELLGKPSKEGGRAHWSNPDTAKSSSPDLSSLYLKGAAQEPTLEQIFARVGANGVPAAVTN